ncbi:MAG TPA: outer membrane lipoprotein-sorting protein, partial [Campylobacterales bacterium]|nr:outer membrane lipoprotein-sorting protein [Campylobacterales bacterium]
KKQKFEGSDFSYEDMGASDAFIKDYDSRVLGEENKNGFACYKVKLVRKPESTLSYPKLMMWVIKDNFVPVSAYLTLQPQLPIYFPLLWHI